MEEDFTNHVILGVPYNCITYLASRCLLKLPGSCRASTKASSVSGEGAVEGATGGVERMVSHCLMMGFFQH